MTCTRCRKEFTGPGWTRRGWRLDRGLCLPCTLKRVACVCTETAKCVYHRDGPVAS